MSRKPAITISRVDLERIEALLDRMPQAEAAIHGALREELDRATVLEPSEMPRNVVTMNSIVSFTSEEGGAPQRLALVYPNAAGKPGTVSILAPVGSALLGLAKGKHIDWPTPDGHKHRLTVLAIEHPPGGAGDLHR